MPSYHTWWYNDTITLIHIQELPKQRLHILVESWESYADFFLNTADNYDAFGCIAMLTKLIKNNAATVDHHDVF